MLKLISVNIEGSKHLQLVIPFIQSQNPDVVCMQEVVYEDMPFLEKELGMTGVFAPMAYGLIVNGPDSLMGVALFSKNPIQRVIKEYYVGSEDRLVHLEQNYLSLDNFHDMINRVVIFAEIVIGVDIYRVATTHFTWTPKGNVTEYQLRDLKNLLAILEKNNDFVLTGDFNAPRGLETFTLLSQKYKDNIPKEYTTSLDPVLHRVPGLPYMVDGLFTTPQYQAHNVKLQDGVSDHMAIISEIEKIK